MNLDSFISHKPAIQNLYRIKEVGLETHLREQRERRLLLEELLDRYNSGKEMSFSCVVSALMLPSLIRKGIEETERIIGDKNLDTKEKAKIFRKVFETMASELGIDLKLRKRAREKPGTSVL